jgi:hypothetical protein
MGFERIPSGFRRSACGTASPSDTKAADARVHE